MMKNPNIIFFTGAGVSVASGLGTFRGSAKALWENFDVNMVCNINTFHANRPKVFDFYNQRKTQYNDVKPNSAHLVIREAQKILGASIFTSNVDLLHEAAGSPATHVHGRMDEMLCIQCDHRWSIGDGLFEEHGECPSCKSTDIKPGIVLFGEQAPLYRELADAVEDNNSIKIVMGSSLSVLSPWDLGYGHGKMILIDPEANPDQHGLYFDLMLAKKAEDVTLEEILELVAKVQSF